ncbi:class I adenylate-forming enzyme family protein [Streptomyces sp. NPDC049967]|uniref:class I adenylate-forming enzyme family protein n=1 Tax=Streptomyces sp. NPDC049967 TaxID=3155658 RepID=UPI00342FD920
MSAARARAPRVRPAGPTSLPALLAHRAATAPDRPALLCGPHRLTFSQWHDRARALASGLRARGHAAGDRVALRYGSADWAEYAVAYCGVLLAGCVAVPVSDRQAPAVFAHVLRDSGAALVLHAAEEPPPAVPAPDSSAPPVRTVTVAEITAAGDPGTGTLPLPAPDTLAQILYTSGTTGVPKGVTATHGNLAHGCTLDERRRPLRHSAYFLHAFPVGTNAGQTMLVNALDSAAAGIAAPRFTPARFARLIEEHAVGSVFLVPAMAIELLGSGPARRFSTDSVRLVGSTAAALPQTVAVGLADAFPRAQIVNYYTSTEAAPAQITLLFDPGRPESPGRPASLGELRITAADGTPLPTGEPGEVWLRTPASPRTYLGDPEAGAEVFQGRWVRMGDLGRLDDEGYLHLLDRERDVVKSGAHKVSTLQVENALHAHPAVADAAALGVPHPVLGSVIAAVVVPRGEVTVPELRTFLLDRLAPHELPARLLFRSGLPRNEGGKILKRELRLLLDDEAPR